MTLTESIGARAPRIKRPRCVECGRKAVLTTGAETYPDEPEFHDRPMWRCECGAFVGCHQGTTKFLGAPAGPETRIARQRARRAIEHWRTAMREAHGWSYHRSKKEVVRHAREVGITAGWQWSNREQAEKIAGTFSCPLP